MQPNTDDEGVRTGSTEPHLIDLKYLSFALLLSLLIPSATLPQRYGRPYNLVSNSQLLLQVSVQKKNRYLSVDDLRKLPRIVVVEVDPATHQSHRYEGVALDKLLPPADPNASSESLEIEYASHQTATISGNDQNALTKSIVVDTIDGKPLAGYAPYELLETHQSKRAVLLAGLYHLTLKTP
jgi:hypothetical protein